MWEKKSIDVIIFRGFGGQVFSTGMDRLSEKIQNIHKVKCVHIRGYESWASVPAPDPKTNTVLIGHSFGALAAYKIVSTYPDINFPLVVTFDYSPYYSGIVGLPPKGIVPKNVKYALNFYQKVDPLVRGMVLNTDGHGGVENIERNLAHVEIDKSEELHQITIDRIKKYA